nr:sigma-70 family RNA polymerase sigma factor [Priestia koreensis]
MINKYSKDLYRYIYSLTHDHHLAEDILQDTFYKAYVHLVDTKEVLSIKAWLFRVARNAFIDYCRKNKNLRIYEETFFESLKIDSSLETEEFIFRNEHHKLIAHYLSTMKSKYRDAVMWVDIKGLSYSEAAEKMGVKITYLKSLLFRGRKELQKLLREEVKET